MSQLYSLKNQIKIQFRFIFWIAVFLIHPHFSHAELVTPQECHKSKVNCSQEKPIKNEESMTLEDEIWDQCCAREFLKRTAPLGMIVIFGSARLKEDHPSYIQIRQFAKKWAEQPQSKKWPIASGGGDGLMEAANRGAYDAHSPTIGLSTYFSLDPDNISSKQNVNAYLKKNEYFMYRSFTNRESDLIDHAKAIVVGLGGIGTEWELYEAFSKLQTTKKDKVPIILLGPETYWETFINRMYFFEKNGTISSDDCTHINITNSVDKAIQLINMSEVDRVNDSSSLCQAPRWKKLRPQPH